MKTAWYGFIAFGNLLFFLINGWKLLFTFHPGGLAVVGGVLALIHLCYFVPMFFKARKEAKLRYMNSLVRGPSITD